MRNRFCGQSGVALGPHLLPPEVGVAPRLGEQFLVGPLLNHAAVLHDEDLVDGLEPSETVGDEEERASIGHVQEIGRERVGGRGFEMFGRFVEYEHREVGQQGSGHGQTLALTPRQAGPVRPHLCRQPSR